MFYILYSLVSYVIHFECPLLFENRFHSRDTIKRAYTPQQSTRFVGSRTRTFSRNFGSGYAPSTSYLYSLKRRPRKVMWQLGSFLLFPHMRTSSYLQSKMKSLPRFLWHSGWESVLTLDLFVFLWDIRYLLLEVIEVTQQAGSLGLY